MRAAGGHLYVSISHTNHYAGAGAPFQAQAPWGLDCMRQSPPSLAPSHAHSMPSSASRKSKPRNASSSSGGRKARPARRETSEAKRHARPARAYVVRRSRIHGRGVFATRTIRKGSDIVEYRGRRISMDEADNLPD